MPLSDNCLLYYQIGDQPMTCPTCGARTDFETFESGLEEHRCLNKNCGLRFFAGTEAISRTLRKRTDTKVKS
jgi:hypothetical protein